MVGKLPEDLGCRSPSIVTSSKVLIRDLTPGF